MLGGAILEINVADLTAPKLNPMASILKPKSNFLKKVYWRLILKFREFDWAFAKVNVSRFSLKVSENKILLPNKNFVYDIYFLFSKIIY